MATIKYTKEDYMGSTEPYSDICERTGFAKSQRLEELADHAESLGVKNFRKLFKEYEKEYNSLAGGFGQANETNFTGQKLQLRTGVWEATDYGIERPSDKGMLSACSHPLLPIERLTSIDTHVEKIRLAFKRGRAWREVICDKKTIASNNAILELSNSGIGVNSTNAQHMVKYLADVEALNYDDIPEKKSTSKLGWAKPHGFSPYVPELVFDGDDNFRTFFESVRSEGDFDEWIKLAKEIRASKNPAPRIILAASFGSVLVEPLGGLPFFVHLWGGTEVGKTVGLMFAASVWANPEIGKYIHSFNSTAVAQELSASFVNSLPLILDELQMIKDKKDFDQMIYQLCEGVGKGRGQKSGGLQKTGTWQNCILTSGEQPISSASSGGGAVNRIIEIECNDKLFEDPCKVAGCVKKNFGHAGQFFVEQLEKEENLHEAHELQKEFFYIANQSGATEKQAMAASIIMTADWLINKLLFEDEKILRPNEILQFLSSKDEVSEGFRALEWLKGWIAENSHRFDINDSGYKTTARAGKFEVDQIVIIRKVFNDICRDAGFSSTSFASWLKKNGYTKTEADRTDSNIRIDGVITRSVVLIRDKLN